MNHRIVAGILVLLVGGLVGSASATRSPARSLGAGVLVSDATGATHARGLWLVSPDGRRTRLLSRRWSPIAWSRRGVAVLPARGAARSPIVVLSGRRTVRVPGSRDAACVAWSSDGRSLTYVTGTSALLHGPGPKDDTWTVTGTLWVARLAAPRAPEPIAQGVFPSTGCPSWSPAGATLAFVVKAADSEWQLVEAQGAASTTVATLRTPTPSTYSRTFAWSRDGSLVFVDGNELFRFAQGIASRIGGADSLSPVEAQGTADGRSRFMRALSVSPDGRRIAASIGGATGIFSASDGALLRIAPGFLKGWAGNVGVLTERVYGIGGLVLFRYAFDPGDAGRALQETFKLNVVTDPDGRWFAFPNPHGVQVDFRRLSGERLRRVWLPFLYPWVIAAVATDGRVAPSVVD
jgi:hypothetical protein